MDPLILASQSPRRSQLLRWAEIDFEVMVSDADESFPQKMPIIEIPVYIARQKAAAIKQRNGKGRLILAADTIVVLGNQVIGKPGTAAEAIDILQSLSGRKHEVITGVYLSDGNREVAFADTTEVSFHLLSDEQIRYYVEKYQPLDKAGAYAIQEWIGVTGIQKINGDFYNVMGLPVSRVVAELKSWNV